MKSRRQGPGPGPRRDDRKRPRRPARPRHLEPLEDRTLLATVVVNDGTDRAFVGTPGSPSTQATITLRDAIDLVDGTLAPAALSAAQKAQVTGTPGTAGVTDTIRFLIAGSGLHTIQVAAALPAITHPATLDGTSQPGWAANTASVGDNAVLTIGIAPAAGVIQDGLALDGGGATVQGLAIGGFAGDGVLIDSSSNTVVGDFLGTLDGLAGDLDLRAGVEVVNGSGNVVGGPAGQTNIIAGGQYGVLLNSGRGTTVSGNLIGVNATGAAGLGGGEGISDVQGAGDTLGGATPGAGNVISGGSSFGIALGGATTGVRILGNRIGTDAAGTAALPNAGGIALQAQSTGNTVGGAQPGEGNVISGNAGYGILLDATTDNLIAGDLVGLDAAGTAAVPNAAPLTGLSGGILVRDGSTGNTIGGVAPGSADVISGNAGFGIEVLTLAADPAASSGNLIEGVVIGLDAAGTAAVANTAVPNGQPGFGVGIFSTPGISILASTVSGNASDGLRISGAGSTGTIIHGDLIGTNLAGTAALGNGGDGVDVQADPAVTIGGTAAGAGDTISGNAADGILLAAGSTGAVIQGDRIGTDAAGAAALGNLGDGIDDLAGSTTIGGAAPGAPDLISGNAVDGIFERVAGDLIQGDRIGTNLAGAAAVGNGQAGIVFSGISNTTIGGTAAGQGDLVSGGLGYGIILDASSGNLIAGDLVGLDATGTLALGNATGGILVRNGSSSNTIGGTAPGSRDVVSGNGGFGIEILSLPADATTSDGDLIQGDLVGLNAAGTAAVANFDGAAGRGDGIAVEGATRTSITGSTISGNDSDGIFLTSASDTVISGDRIGLDPSGAVALGNGLHGIEERVSAGVTIGGTASGAGDVISGNLGDGIALNGGAGSGVLVLGNLIGLTADGAAALGNRGDGIFVTVGIPVQIGGPSPLARNVISGNLANGIEFRGTNGGDVAGNYIGTDITGHSGLGNVEDGIYAVNTAGLTVGGAAPASMNVISGNIGSGLDFQSQPSPGVAATVVEGNIVGLDAAGTVAISNHADGIYAGSQSNLLIEGDVVSSNYLSGIALEMSDGTVVGNTVGLGPGGMTAYGNGEYGIFFNAAAGPDPANPRQLTITGNTVGGNRFGGVDGLGNGGVVSFNRVGTDAAGTAPVTNGGDGIAINATGAVILGNLVSGNLGQGISLTAAGDQATGNTVGTDVTGTHALGNGLNGILVGSDRDAITGNLVSGNLGNGVEVDRAEGTTVTNNRIGTDAAGMAAIGNALAGIFATYAYTPGDPTQIIGNVVSGNILDGIDLTGQGAQVAQDLVGTNIAGTAAIPNGGNGIDVFGIGVAQPAANVIRGNLVSGNMGAGVALTDGRSDQVISNTIGVTARGMPLGNHQQGIFASETDGELINSNLITSNAGDGIADVGGSGDVITSNRIGATAADVAVPPPGGTPPPGNGLSGVALIGADGIFLGGTAPGSGNVISGNGLGNHAPGVSIDGNSSGNLVGGNLIGLDIGGRFALANGGDGILSAGSYERIVSNVASGNFGSGVDLIAGSDDEVLGNTLGLDASGTAPVANLNGLVVADRNAGVADNVISGNAGFGISVTPEGTATIIHNLVGTDSAGSAAVENGLSGVRLAGDDAQLVLNTISGNVADGVSILAGADSSILSLNRIGLNSAGTAAVPNRGSGVIDLGDGTMILGNTISGNAGAGIGAGALGTVIAGNVVGTDPSGTQKIGNQGAGVDLFDAPGRSATVRGNVISGNRSAGIEVAAQGTTTGTPTGSTYTIADNLIGTDVTGEAALGNAGLGIFLDVVDSTFAVTGNLISANGQVGLVSESDGSLDVEENRVGTDGAGKLPLPNGSDGVVVPAGPGLTVKSNVISGNLGTGLRSYGTSLLDQPGGSVTGNLIGTDITGSAPLGNGGFGYDDQTPGVAFSGNTVSANGIGGILVDIGQGAGGTFSGNAIGTDAGRSAAIGNGGVGIELRHATGVTLGGSTPGAGNQVSASGGDGILLDATASGDLIRGGVVGGAPGLGNAGVGVDDLGTGDRSLGVQVSSNAAAGVALAGQGDSVSAGLIGTDAAGLAALPNLGGGVVVTGSGDAVDSSVISGNAGPGVLLRGSTGAAVTSDLIGTDPGGSRAVANTGGGVLALDASGSAIGTTSAGDIVAGNAGTGVAILGTSMNNTVAGDRIGLSFPGGVPTRLLNTSYGVYVGDSATNNTVGDGNIIAGNALDGVAIVGPDATGNIIQGSDIGYVGAGPGVLAMSNGTGSPDQSTGEVTSGGGILLVSSTGNTIGSASKADPNVISGNANIGVQVFGGSGNTIRNSRIGTDATGTLALSPATSTGNPQLDGIELRNSPGNTVGPGDVISGNFDVGLRIFGGMSADNRVVGDQIGTDPLGVSAVPNRQGILITGASNNTIGTASQGNVISGNSDVGIQVLDDSALPSILIPGPAGDPTGYASTAASGNVIQGNFIGTDASGKVAITTDGADAQGGGVFINQATNTQVVGSNVISGNANFGVQILGAQATGNAIHGNFIGTDSTKTVNLSDNIGVYLFGSTINAIGTDNEILFNKTEPVRIRLLASGPTVSTITLLDANGNPVTPGAGKVASVQVLYNTYVNPTNAARLSNYRVGPAAAGIPSGPNFVDQKGPVVYNPLQRTATIPVKDLPVRGTIRVSVVGTPPGGIVDTMGNPLDGTDNIGSNLLASNFTSYFRDGVLLVLKTKAPQARAKAVHPSAVDALSASGDLPPVRRGR